MATHLFCQSCSMPIDNIGDRGKEENGSVSNEYCKYCYQRGVFTAPGITMEAMKAFMQSKMQEMKIPGHIVQQSLEMLPHLKRWKKAGI